MKGVETVGGAQHIKKDYPGKINATSSFLTINSCTNSDRLTVKQITEDRI